MRSLSASLALLGGLLALAAPAPAAAAEAEEGRLAAPGRCAEPRRFQASACTDCAEEALAGEGFDVAGPISGRFAPADVAAPAGTGAAVAPPTLGGFDGRGPCDSPGSGCLGTVAPAPAGPSNPSGAGRGVRVIERPPNPGGPPGRPGR
jgi:hypothetical protein